MKRPSFIHGVGLALLLSFFGSALFTTATTMVAASSVIRVLIALLGLVYVVYLLRRSRERIGRISTIALWGVAAALTWFFVPALPLYLIIHVGMIWLIRSLYFYSGVLPAIADLGLSMLSLAAAIWAAGQSNSMFLAIWCFFLVQALFVSIPSSIRRKEVVQQARAEDEAFQRAHRAAEAAVRRLSVSS